MGEITVQEFADKFLRNNILDNIVLALCIQKKLNGAKLFGMYRNNKLVHVAVEFKGKYIDFSGINDLEKMVVNFENSNNVFIEENIEISTSKLLSFLGVDASLKLTTTVEQLDALGVIKKIKSALNFLDVFKQVAIDVKKEPLFVYQ